jgi:hypothetical protein
MDAGEAALWGTCGDYSEIIAYCPVEDCPWHTFFDTDTFGVKVSRVMNEVQGHIDTAHREE